MVPDNSPARWDAAVVFFSDFGPYGGLDDESLRRLNYALYLHQNGRALVIICSEGVRPSRNLHGSAFMKRYLLESAVEEARTIVENHLNHTLGNLTKTQALMQRRQLPRAVVSSSPIHLPRVKRLTLRIEAAPLLDATAYDLNRCDPPIGWNLVYQQVHHEFAA